MNKKYVLLLDNSFIETYCYNSNEKDLLKVCQYWNSVMKDIALRLPDFENDYTINQIQLCMFENIGLGAFKHYLSTEKKELLNNCFPHPCDLLVMKETFDKSPEIVIEIIDKHLTKTFEKLFYFYFYKNELSVEDILDKISNKIQQQLHPNVENLRTLLIEWQNDIMQGKDGDAFQSLCVDLAWDSLVKYKGWTELHLDPRYIEFKTNNEQFIKIEEAVITRLLIYYLNINKNGNYFATSVLFNKLALLSKKSEGGSFKIDRELLDPYLIDAACAGFFDEKTKCRTQVIVLTCEKEYEKKVRNYMLGKSIFDQKLITVGLEKSSELMPGYIIDINPMSHFVRDIIDVLAISAEIESGNAK